MRSDDLIKYWRDAKIISDERLLSVFVKIDRRTFVPPELEDQAYDDRPLPIGSDQTISQPTTVMIMTQALQIERGMKILEVGCGSGYQAAMLGLLTGPAGRVFSVERLSQLVAIARKNLASAGVRNVIIIEGDGTEGYAPEAPYDRIIVTAAAPAIPTPLALQLKEGGKIVVPVGDQFSQKMIVGTKKAGEIITQSIGDFVFVPLIGKYGFKDDL